MIGLVRISPFLTKSHLNTSSQILRLAIPPLSFTHVLTSQSNHNYHVLVTVCLETISHIGVPVGVPIAGMNDIKKQARKSNAFKRKECPNIKVKYFKYFFSVLFF